MQPPHPRLICRAHNSFSPSIALWQHFVQAHPFNPRDRRQLSTATQAAQDDAAIESKHVGPDSPTPSEARPVQKSQLETEDAAKNTAAKRSKMKMRKVKTTKGKWLPSKAAASTTKNKKLKGAIPEALLKQRTELLDTARSAFNRSQSYKGVVVKPMVSEAAIKESELPWCLKKEDRAVPGMERLRLEIARFYKYTTANQHETLARRHLIEQVRNHLRKWIPEYKVEVFGSERTGIGMPLSDIDFRLVPESEALDPAQARLPPSPEQRIENIKILRSLYNRSFRRDWAYLLSVVRHARYPLISAQDRLSGLDVQIVLANDTSISRVIMHGYMDEIPYLRELYWVVKTVFDIRGLSDVFRGGLGSYSLFMMVVASIKHAPEPPKDSAQALLNFLYFWGNFDTTKQGVSIEPAYLYDKVEHPVLTDTQRAKLKNDEIKPLPDYMLSLRDPADETNDLGRKGMAIKHVQVTLRDLHYQLNFDARVNTRPSILAPLVGSSYMLQLERRRKLEGYGRHLEHEAQRELSQKAKAVREADQLVHSMSEQAVDEGAQKTDAEEEDALKKENEEQETKIRLAKELRDREWQRLTDEMHERLKKQAEKTSASEHGDAIASSLSMPAVEEPTVEEPTVEGGAQPEKNSIEDKNTA
ncbi:non-canonical poly(A) RNA polymerase PAPD5/7 [Alternaria panax]|uniref:Non-canonical poly(A) RNA polymerase PAPD5/7 n=1 Tax=Alternaria panax TaxID=48097 RepID=A0AAD4FH12_9PLEO|nr:non-canonical poly(A) RNA polymerase PAPD5/7 [Alternaria panax]